MISMRSLASLDSFERDGSIKRFLSKSLFSYDFVSVLNITRATSLELELACTLAPLLPPRFFHEGGEGGSIVIALLLFPLLFRWRTVNEPSPLITRAKLRMVAATAR